MVEPAKMGSTLSHVTALMDLLETCVKQILMNVMESSVRMVVLVKMQSTTTSVAAPVDSVEGIVKQQSTMVI